MRCEAGHLCSAVHLAHLLHLGFLLQGGGGHPGQGLGVYCGHLCSLHGRLGHLQAGVSPGLQGASPG